MHDITNVNSNINRKNKILEEFNGKFNQVEKILENIYLPDKIEIVRNDCLAEFEKLLEEISYNEGNREIAKLIR